MRVANATFTVETKHLQLAAMREDQKQLGRKIDVIMRASESSGKSASASFCNWLMRRFSTRQRVATTDASSTRVGSTNSDVHRAVFGLAGAKKGNPAAKLEEAASVMKARIAQLEERAADERKQAVLLQKAGQKAHALRALKKAKAIEAQLESNSASLMAVEQQVDMLAQAAMQQTLTNALASTSKQMKGNAKMLSKAEKAVDEATEVRDLASDLNGVMAEFAQAGAGEADDEELVAELNSMLDETPPPASASSDADADSAKKAEIEMLERKIAAREDADAWRAGLPAAPKNEVKMQEKAKLLAESMVDVEL